MAHITTAPVHTITGPALIMDLDPITVRATDLVAAPAQEMRPGLSSGPGSFVPAGWRV
jgi:hypothetical protein